MILEAGIPVEEFLEEEIECKQPADAEWEIPPVKQAGWNIEALEALFELDYEPVKFSPFDCGRCGEWVGMKRELWWENLLHDLRNDHKGDNQMGRKSQDSKASAISIIMRESKDVGCWMCYLQEDAGGEIDRLCLKSKVHELEENSNVSTTGARSQVEEDEGRQFIPFVLQV